MKIRLIIFSLVFFLLVNTSYYWEGQLGFFAFPVFIFLILAFGVLLFCLFYQFYLAVKEKFSSQVRMATLVILAGVLTLSFFFPAGMINFSKFDSQVILLAQREGAANCMTTLKLKLNNTFLLREVCFGITEVKGKYRLAGDTIHFENVSRNTELEEGFHYGILRFTGSGPAKQKQLVILYKDRYDTIGRTLSVMKNELN